MYKVFGLPASRAFRVLWALEEIGAPYELVPCPPRSDVVKRLNPSGKIPVLQHGDEILTDSTAILSYLADRHACLTAPMGTLERTRQDALTYTLLDELDALVWTAARHSFVLPQEHRYPDIKRSLKWEFSRNLDRISENIEGPFLMGDELRIPDIVFLHSLDWAKSARFPIDNPAVEDYSKRLHSRPAFKRVAALLRN